MNRAVPARRAGGRPWRVLALALVLALAPSAAGAEEGASWGVRPADGALGFARANFRYTAVPGETIEDALVVSNHGAQPLALRVLGVDGSLSADGEVELARADAAPARLGAWIGLEPVALELAPGESVEVRFTLAVPTGLAPGAVAGAVVTSSLAESERPGVAVDRRLASSIVVDVVDPAPGSVPTWAVLALGALAVGALATWLVVVRGRVRG